MTAYAIFDVEIHNPDRYRDFMEQVKPALEAAGARYLTRGGAHKVYEGDWIPRRIFRRDNLLCCRATDDS